MPTRKNRKLPKKGKNPRSGRRRGASKRVPSIPRAMATRLSACSEEYVRSLADPYTSPPACIPSFPSLPSEKFKVWAKGSWSCAPSVTNFIMFNPNAMLCNDVSDANAPVHVTDGTYAGATFVTVAAGVGNAKSNSAFTLSNITSEQLEARLVSAGLRIKYADTKLKQGGTIQAIHTADHTNLTGQTVATYMQSRDEAIREALTNHRGWLSINYHPVDQSDFDYQATDTGDDLYVIGASVDTGETITLLWEAYANFEATGAAARAKTGSFADPVGLSAVTNAFSLDIGLQQPSWDTSALWGTLRGAAGQLVGEVVSGVGRQAAPMAVAGITEYLRRRLTLGGSNPNQRRIGL